MWKAAFSIGSWPLITVCHLASSITVAGALLSPESPISSASFKGDFSREVTAKMPSNVTEEVPSPSAANIVRGSF